MRQYRTFSGPFREGLYIGDSEIETACEDALREVGLYPGEPEAVRIERFIEKKFGVTPRFEELPEGVLGYSCYGSSGMTSMHISHALMASGRVGERRALATIAHEAGHGLFHGPYLALDSHDLEMFGDDPDVTATKILCRDEADSGVRRTYDGRWWELQANKAIGPLLLPRGLVKEAVRPLLVRRGTLIEIDDIPSERRDEAAKQLVDIFDVNPIAAKIRLKAIFPPADAQLTL